MSLRTSLSTELRDRNSSSVFSLPFFSVASLNMEEFKMDEYVPPSTKIPFQSDKEYNVFLSFRGEDVRKNLVDHLFEALTAAGLHVFLDSHKLRKGEIIGLSLERAIESSAIRIPVFSRGYADSSWCLKEAAAMLRTPGLIIPLFYDVLPSDVRYPLKDSSQYKQAFLKHYGRSDRYPREEIEWWKHALQQICPFLKFYGHSVRYPRKGIEGWKDALLQISSRSGWSMDTTGGFEAQLVKRVVNDVIQTLDKVPLEVAEHPVGIETVTKDLIHKFKLNSKGGVVKAGIWGIGGIGKTTATKALYSQVYAHFDAASFVFNVRATAVDSMGLTKLQKKILKDLCMYSGEVDSVDEGISLFRYRLGRKRVLLILDDVDAMEQSNALVGDWLAPGSRVIITSRDRHILHVSGVSSECIHEMNGLQINEGLQTVHTAISNLALKLLIKIDDNGVFDMHDHLRDMGRTIAEKEKQGTRLWEGAHLSTISNDINFSRLQLNGGNFQSFATLCRSGLRFLHLKNLLIDGITEDTLAMLSSSLIWLSGGKEIEEIPSSLEVWSLNFYPFYDDHWIHRASIAQETTSSVATTPTLAVQSSAAKQRW
ncbi:hypothetical protein SUGI_1082780 [Cryptomeria japonica]|nr:hypothetical protein SUGI_1082780 [Cryptomeria japonica]